jgi:hypothetical protein
MRFVRRTFLVFLGAVLPFLLFATAFNFGVLQVVGSPTPVKKILSDSGIYSSVVSSALDQAKTSSNGSTEVSLIDPAIKKAAEESFSPQVVQHSSEQAIDGIFDWLNGKSAQPDFNIDLTSVKSGFAEKVGQAAQAKAATLPKCTSAPTTTDPFGITCLPPGITPAQVGEQAKNDVLNGQGFLEHPNITANSIKNDTTGQSVFDSSKLKDAPKRYQLFKKTPYILLCLVVLTILAIVFLSTSRRKGLRHVAVAFAFVGLFMLAFAWGLNRVVSQNVIPQINLDNKVLQSNVRILASDVVHSVDQNYWIFGIAYASVGIVVLLLTILKGRGENKKAHAATKAPSAESKPAPKPQPRPAPQKPKSPPRIQG